MDHPVKMFKIDSDLDIDTDSQYAYVKLFTGQKVRLTREIVKKMYESIVRRDGKTFVVDIETHEFPFHCRWPSRSHKPVNMDFSEVEMRVVAAMVDIEPDWPKGTANAPIWVTADKRSIPVTEMTDDHIGNAIRYFGRVINELKEEKEYIVDIEGWDVYKERMRSATGRIDMVKKERARREGK